MFQESGRVLLMNRRTLLKTLAVAGLGTTLPGLALGQTFAAPAQYRVWLRYLETLARPDGGYGWDDQPHSHLTPTFAVIGSYRLLGQTPPQC